MRSTNSHLVRLLSLWLVTWSHTPGFCATDTVHRPCTALTWRTAPIAFDGWGIVYASGRDAGFETDLLWSGTDPAWTKDRQRFAVGHLGNGRTDSGIYVFRLGHGRKITKGTSQYGRLTHESDDYPTWSPDASRMVFSRTVDELRKIRRLCVIDLTTRKITELTNGDFEDTQPQWSPDGKTIAFRSNRSGKLRIWLLSMVDRSVRPLKNPPPGDWSFPCWSPDSNRLLVVSSGANTNGELAVASLIDLKSGRRTRLRLPRLIEDRVVYSPDGQRIAFMRVVKKHTWAIYIAKLDGSQQRRVLPRHKGGFKNGFGLAW